VRQAVTFRKQSGKMSQNRYVVVPTVTVLAVMKARLVGAVKGHALLKKKADALTVRYAFSPCRPDLPLSFLRVTWYVGLCSNSFKSLLPFNRFRQILKKIVDTKEGMGKKMRDSSFALTEAKYAAGEFRHTVFDSVETVRTSEHLIFCSIWGKRVAFIDMRLCVL